MEIVTLEMNICGRARIVEMRDQFKEGNPTGKVYVTLRYEGGEINMPILSDLLKGFDVGDIVDVWLSCSPKDFTYNYQGRIVSTPGFRVLGVLQLQKISE